MKSQSHNEGQLAELKVNIEESVVKAFVNMEKYSGISIDDLVVIALKRFRSSHADYEGKSPIDE